MIRHAKRPLAAAMILLIGGVCIVGFIGSLPKVFGDSTVFYFHNRSEIYRNENGSIYVYDGADHDPPLAGEAFSTVFRCNVVQQLPIGFFSTTVHASLVSWITPPLTEDYVANGIVSVSVWLSSDDENTQGSGFLFALTDQDENDNIGDRYYNYFYETGKAISSKPTEYSLDISVNHVFVKGHKIAFGVILGSTTSGWTGNVYFDSEERDSRALLPGTPMIVPEFQERLLLLGLTFTVPFAFFLRRKRSKYSAALTITSSKSDVSSREQLSS